MDMNVVPEAILNENTAVDRSKCFHEDFNFSSYCEDLKEKDANLKNVHLSLVTTWETFQDGTTSHGFPQFGRAKVKRYMQHQVNVKILLVHEKTMKFPAVTICNNNQMKISNLKNNSLFMKKINMYKLDMNTRHRSCVSSSSSSKIETTSTRAAPTTTTMTRNFTPGSESLFLNISNLDCNQRYGIKIVKNNNMTFYYPNNTTPQMNCSHISNNDSECCSGNSVQLNDTTEDGLEVTAVLTAAHTTLHTTTVQPANVDCQTDNDYSEESQQQRGDFKLTNQVVEQLMTMEQTDRKNKGHQLEDMIIDCSYAEGQCNLD
ncbi:hypothetical protein HELRODRAFT_168370 [Helobdella robusta]|uniref:Uncharacterized protein n=1 Tax=Helobdella robusta TaxID=6412 RepID=T1F0H8_HELRO|nr:hypothetical protein HELRODRAFT_168370 [Helobdella robusta]ESO09389.1 hypothetical protein HELRODRAFT_168370 [Helobdella robusta]